VPEADGSLSRDLIYRLSEIKRANTKKPPGGSTKKIIG
jgi:hypothetical protein